jgi:hypothetical protein
MTGMTDRIIHSGRVPERRKASIRRSRLMAFLRRWPDVVRTSTWRARQLLEIHPADDVADRLCAHRGVEDTAAAAARAVALVQVAEVVLRNASSAA